MTDASGRPLRILVRSDSQGTSLDIGHVPVDDPRLWANVLREELRAAGEPAEVRNASAPGIKVGEALDSHRHDPLVRAVEEWADVVTVTLGINDLWPMGRPPALARVMEQARPTLVRRVLRKGYSVAEPRVMTWTKGSIRATPRHRVRRDLTVLAESYLRAGKGVVLVTPYPVRSTADPSLDGNSGETSDLVCDVAAAVGVPVVDCRALVEPLDWKRASEEHVHVGPDGHRAIAGAVRAALGERDHLGLRVGTGEPPDAQERVLVRGDLAGALGPAEVRDALGVRPLVALRHGFSVHEELRSVRHDPLVREPAEAAAGVLLAPGGPTRPSTWDRERLGVLVDELRQRGPVVLADDRGPWSSAIRDVAREWSVPTTPATTAALRNAVDAMATPERTSS